jgi:hypothetical protein
VVAKGVSPPTLESWLLICLSETKSAAYLAALLAFMHEVPIVIPFGRAVESSHLPRDLSKSAAALPRGQQFSVGLSVGGYLREWLFPLPCQMLPTRRKI